VGITPPWFETYVNTDGTKKVKNGDFEFLAKIHEQGYKTYINTDVLVQHLVVAHVDTKLHDLWRENRRGRL